MGTFIGQFKKGMKVGKETHKEFELREMTTEDLLTAELEIGLDKPMNFKAQLASLQLVRVGTYDGPFTVSMIKALNPVDFRILTDQGLNGVSALGEGSSPSNETD